MYVHIYIERALVQLFVYVFVLLLVLNYKFLQGRD